LGSKSPGGTVQQLNSLTKYHPAHRS
jgi:hypothetical protein